MSNIRIIKEYGTLFPKFISFIKNNKVDINKTFTQREIRTLMFDYLKNEECWDKAGHRTSFNQIQKLRMTNVIKEVVRNTNNNTSYLQLENDNKFYIRKQDEFHFILVCQIYEYLKKNKHVELLDEYFIETDEDLIVN